MTPGQFQNCLDGYKKRQENSAKMIDGLNHILGNYISIGVNDPMHYPTKAQLSKPEKRYLSNEELMEKAKAMTLAMGGTVQ